jgi:L-alanine-DL-glutamate epimerase-like enolase superfamily enzyme
MANLAEINHITAIFVRLETRQGYNAWGCAVAHPDLTGESPEHALRACWHCVELVPDLHPTQVESSLARLAPHTQDSPAAACAYDLAFHDLLGLAASMPLYRLLGGYRNRIQTSATIPVADVHESVDLAQARARQGFRMLKIKGGCDPDEDVRRVHAIHRALPGFKLRLDADGGYTVQQALEVARALNAELEMLEQPTHPSSLEDMQEVTRHSPIPILADQSIAGPASALEFAAHHGAHVISVKVATCGGLISSRQVDNIARAARLSTMISCVVEPALMIAAGLSLALSSPNVHYCDLDGYLDLIDDPTQAGFHLEDGWLIENDVPGLGCTVFLP